MSTTATKKRVTIPEVPNDGQHEVMAFAGQSWGRGAGAAEARKALRRHESTRPITKYVIVPRGAWVDDIGTTMEWKPVPGHPSRSCEKCTFQK